LWAFSGFFRVEPDEVGVVLRFGQFVREVQPGLNYHLLRNLQFLVIYCFAKLLTVSSPLKNPLWDRLRS